MSQEQALKGIIICLGILVVIFIIYLISTYKDRRLKRFKRRTNQWDIGDRIIMFRYYTTNTHTELKPDDKIYRLVGWNVNNIIISDIQNTMHTVRWSDHFRNVTAENRTLLKDCVKDMHIAPGFKVNDNETNRLYP